MSVANSNLSVRYRPIDGCPGYRVGDDGSVWSCRSRNGKGPLKSQWMKLKQYSDPRGGYLFVILHQDKKKIKHWVHRLVLEAFVGQRPSILHFTCHKNGVRIDNVPDNLYWGTPKENAQDTIRHGRTSRGEKNVKCRLSESDVIEIRRLRKEDKLSLKTIAARYGVAWSTIGRIDNRQNWKHV